MGMFDSIYVRFRCPNCSDRGEKGLQTKEGPRILASYKVGNTFKLENNWALDELKQRKKYYLKLLGSCDNCKTFFMANAELDKNQKIKEVAVWGYFINIEPEIMVRK